MEKKTYGSVPARCVGRDVQREREAAREALLCGLSMEEEVLSVVCEGLLRDIEIEMAAAPVCQAELPPRDCMRMTHARFREIAEALG